MKINVNGYEVEITAKRGDEDATLYFLNEMVIAYQEASMYNREKGMPALADYSKK